jgi:DNA-binding transcriptional LysR family regulator
MNSLLKHLRISDLEIFITSMHFKNLSKAAAFHNLSQSAASAVIMRVESAFGRNLCHHEKRQFRLTHEGQILLPKIEEWLRSFKETIAINVDLPIRLVTTNAIARVVLPVILSKESIDLQIMRPDHAYGAILKNEADLAIVPDNAHWKNVCSMEIGNGSFGLYSSKRDAPISPILLPENQMEVLNFMQKWNQMYDKPIEIKARIPSWSLIADLCSYSYEVGFLPDFLARKSGLHPVSWQPTVSNFKMLALHCTGNDKLQKRLQVMIRLCHDVFL